MIHPVAAVSDRQVRTAAGALNAVTPANLSQQVRCSRFQHKPAYWEHIGHRWRGAVALFDFQSQLSPSTIYFARAHRDYRTPFWSVTTATATISLLIFAFITLFSEHRLLGVHPIGLESLTGFATFNLFVPLAVVDIALIYSRRNHPDIERGFSMPLVPALPVVGVLTNLALILNLPPVGVVVGAVFTLGLLVAYFVWGGAPNVEKLVERGVPPGVPATTTSGAPAGGEAEETESERFRILVAIARPERAVPYVRLAEMLRRGRGAEPLVQILNVTHIPDQTPNEMVRETAQERAMRIEEQLSAADIDETVSALTEIESLHVHNVTANTVAEGLVSTTIGDGGLLVIGTTRDRRLRRWVFGSTPD